MNITISIIMNVAISSTVSSAIVYFFKTYLSERIKAKIKSEYGLRLEEYKSELKSDVDKDLRSYQRELDESIRLNNEKWILKREACLNALEMADGILSHFSWSNIDSNKFVKPKVSTIEFRKCYNQLACTCDNTEIMEIFRKILKVEPDLKLDVMTDLRNAIRKELNFGDTIDLDRDLSFIGRIPGDES